MYYHLQRVLFLWTNLIVKENFVKFLNKKETAKLFKTFFVKYF